MTRVLIVDDHEENLVLLRAILEFHGFEVDAARHGAEALLKARREPPQLIISDLLMPVMDGYTLLRHWKADERLNRIPFVVYTATYTDPRDEQLALDLGVDAFIVKPVARAAFMAQIDAVLTRRQHGELVSAPPPVSEPTLLEEYNVVLVRKLETKTEELERTNRVLRDDIGRREQAEETLRLFIEFAPAAIVMFDRDMRYLAVSRRWMADYGIAEQDITGRSHYEIFPDLPQRWKEVHRRCLAGATERADEDSFPRGDGSLDWVRWEMHPWRTADGDIGGIILFSEVITARKQAEDALRLSETRYRTLIEQAADAVLIAGPDGRLQQVNARACELFGYTPEEFVGLSLAVVVAESERERQADALRRLMAGERIIAERQFRRKDGSLFPGELSACRMEGGLSLGLVRDITDRKRLEAERRAASTRFEKLFLGAPEAISISEFDSGRFLEVNDAFCEMFGHAREALIGRTAIELNVWADPERRDMVIGKLCAGERVQGMEGRARTRSGEFREALFSADRIDFGGVSCLLLMFVDITERRQAEAALAESRAGLEALTRRLLEVQETERRSIARELHDEVGGALTAVKLNLQALRRAHTAEQGEAALADGLGLVDGAIQSVRSLSLDLRPAVLDDLGLIPALKWYCDRQARRAGVAIEPALDAIDLKAAPQLESACFRIVQEAVTNALRHGGARHIQVALRRYDGHFMIEIADDGGGFDVAATHKRGLAGECSGLLGMEERANLLGGRLSIDSTPGAGARVRAEFVMPEDGVA